jgi:hypothetical protein
VYVLPFPFLSLFGMLEREKEKRERRIQGARGSALFFASEAIRRRIFVS